MALTCKNCGGNIYLDDTARTIICDSCGVSQLLNTIVDNTIFNETDVSVDKLRAYRLAVKQLSAASTEEELIQTASEFDYAGDIFDAPQLAMECRNRANLLQRERRYKQAVVDMQSNAVSRIEAAMKTFESLGDYKDSLTKLDRCKPLLAKAQAVLDQKLQEYEIRLQRKRERGKRRKHFIIITIVAILLINYAIRKPSNVKISIIPDSDRYVTVEFNDYVFHYDVKIKNKSPLHVTAIEADVYFESPDGTVLVDTEFNVGSMIYQSNPVVRGRKSSEYTWSVTVPSESNAEKLAQYDFDDLKVVIEIKKLRYG